MRSSRLGGVMARVVTELEVGDVGVAAEAEEDGEQGEPDDEQHRRDRG